MWKAITGLIVGLLIGTLVVAPLYAGKKKPDKAVDGVLTDSNRDGIVEFAMPLYRPVEWTHVSCSDGYTHDVFMQVIEGPLGLPWIYMRWKVNLQKTHRERLRMFGPGYWIPENSSDPFEGERW